MKIFVSVKYFIVFPIVRHTQISEISGNSENQVTQVTQISGKK